MTSMAEAEAETQIKHQQVARWRGAQKARLDGSRPDLASEAAGSRLDASAIAHMQSWRHRTAAGRSVITVTA